MTGKDVRISRIRIVAIIFIGIALSILSFWAVITIVTGVGMRDKSYLYANYTSYRDHLIICACMVIFVLMLFFNMRVKLKWLTAVVNMIVIIALCNPLTQAAGLILIPTFTNDYPIRNEADFTQCAEDMDIDFRNFPTYNEFSDQNVRFVGFVDSGFFFTQSITAIVQYDSLELCQADYNAYIDSHQFLTEPVIGLSGHYLIAAPEFYYEGIHFKVVTDGEEDYFPKRIYMIGIDIDNATLYYLYLDDHDLDYIAEPQAQDLEDEMRQVIEYWFNLGK